MKLLMKADLDVTVTMYQNDSQYEVTYGAEFHQFTDFKSALTEFNSCVMHSAACASLLDEDDEYYQD